MATEAQITPDNSAPSAPAPPAGVQTPEQTPQVVSAGNTPTPDPQPPGFTREQVQDLLSKARKDEKDKVYADLEKQKATAKAAQAKTGELESQVGTLQNELEDVRSGKASEMESINRELRESREQIQKLETAIQDVATSAADRVRLSELAAYREKQLAVSGAKLTELVSGDSKEEIDKSILTAKAREEALLKEAREDARRELSHQIPGPIAPDGSHGRSAAPVVTPGRKEQIAQLKGEDYRKVREQLLLEAKQKAGLI